MTAAVYDLMDYDDVLEKYDPVMGMEVHVELATETKMFSASSAHFGAEPNSNVDPASLGRYPWSTLKASNGPLKSGWL